MSIEQAITFQQAGRLAEAQNACRRILAEQPNHAGALHLLGAMALDAKRLDEALEWSSKALAANPRLAEAHCNLGLALAGKKRDDEAIESYRRALSLLPEFTEVWFYLGNALQRKGRLDEAISHYRQALALRPNYLDVYLNLAVALSGKGMLDEAIENYRIALRLRPSLPEALNNLGDLLKNQGRLDEAIDAYGKAIAARPNFSQAIANLGAALKEAGRLDEAIACYRKALDIDPRNVAAHNNLVYAYHFHPDFGPEEILAAQRQWSDQHARPLRQFIRPHDNDRSLGRRLKIGYVSPDFRQHVVGMNLMPLMSQHDHERFEIFCYSGVVRPDEMTRRFQECADQWRQIAGVSDADAAELIRRDKIDILVDLTLFMGGSRLTLFARKPAPIQATYLGYCGGTGLAEMDYRFSDPHMDPPENDLATAYVEKTIQLPRTYWCYQPPEPAPEVTPPPAAKTGFIAFGSMNNFAKASAVAQETWAKIMAALPGSRLILHCQPGSHRQAVLDRFGSSGIDSTRIEFVGRQPVWKYLETFGRIDIALDSFPYGGGITTCDALWMGVPVVTLTGRTAVGRGGRSVLNNIGLSELVAASVDEYKRLAIDLAGNIGRLTELRGDLRRRVGESRLMDAKTFARDVESAYRGMWTHWCGSDSQ